MNNWVRGIAVGFCVLALIGLNQCNLAKALPMEELTPEFYSTVVDPSVQIKSSNGYCSGTLIKKDIVSSTEGITLYSYDVLTAKHCIVPMIKTYDVSIHDEDTKFNATVKTTSYEHDLVTLTFTSFRDLPIAVIAPIEYEDKMKFGLDVISVSYPLGLPQTITEGVLNRKTFSKFSSRDGEYFQRASISTLQGSSGSGLFMENNDYYYLVGVLSFGAKDQDYLSDYVALDTIIDFIEENNHVH